MSLDPQRQTNDGQYAGRARSTAYFFVIAMLLSSLACSPAPTLSEHAHRLEAPAADASAQPRLTLGADGNLYLSWIEPLPDSGHALRFSRRAGDAWSEARTVATGDDWFVNWADFPSLAVQRNGTMAAHWLNRSAEATYAYDVMLSVSSDSGQSWTSPVRPHRDGTPTEHGFVSLVPATDGLFDVIWLDGRQAAATPPGPMTLRHARLGPDGQVTSATVIDSSVCDCCPTDAQRAPDGDLVVAYRGRTDGEVRDIRIARYDGDSWSDPVPVHADGWVIAGCPVNGPAIDARGDALAVAWYTEPSEGEGSVRLSFSDDAGKVFGNAISVGEERPLGRVDLALLEDGSALVSWIEQGDESATILLRHVDQSGEMGPAQPAQTTSVSRSSGFPQMVHHDGEVVIAWTETSAKFTRVRTAVLRF